MGRSFYYEADADLYTASNSFSAKISATPTAFGLVAAQATAYAALNTTWAAAYLAAIDPVTRTKAKVTAKNDAKMALKAKAAELAAIIQATPTVTNEQKIDLGLNVRATPTPVVSLGKPYDFGVGLSETGALDLGWKCASPRASGMTYQIWRRNSPDSEFQYLGGTGEKKFVDATLPAGFSQVTYQIQATRSTAVGAWASFNVNFGVAGGSGALQTTITEGKPVKIAA